MKKSLFILALLASSFAYGQQFYGPNNTTSTIWRDGSIKISNSSEGFLLWGTATDSHDWGAKWYGLTNGHRNTFHLSMSNSNPYSTPIHLSSYYGLGFRTANGKMTMMENGIVTIGLNDTRIIALRDNSQWETYKLYVGGGIRTEKVKVDLQNNWADYVFTPDYNLLPLDQLETYIKENSHLPNIPTAQKLESEGVDLGELTRLQMEKIEELTLYIIELKKEMNTEIDALKEKINALRQ